MGTAIGLRVEFDGMTLRRLSRATKSANQAWRLLALAEIYAGGSRGAAARIGGVGLQIVRDWVMRFNASQKNKITQRVGQTRDATFSAKRPLD